MQAPPPPQQPHQAPHYPGGHLMSSSLSPSTGKTPIAKRTRSSRSANSQNINQNNNNYSNAPPPPPPAPAGYGQQYNQQHPQQVAPPTTTTAATVMMRNTADDAIAKRRAELRRLQQQRGKSSAITERLAATAVPSRSNISSSHQRVSNNDNTARRLDDSYGNNTNNTTSSSSSSSSGSPIINGMVAPPSIMAMKRTSEIFPSKRVSSSSVASHATAGATASAGGPSPPNTTAMSRGIFPSMSYQPVPPPQQQQPTSSQYTQPSPTFQQQQADVPMTSATTTNNNYNNSSNNHYNNNSNNIRQSSPPISSVNSSANNNNVQTKSSPFGQARVLKSTTPVKSLVPPLTMLLLDSPPHLLNDENNNYVDESSSSSRRPEEVNKSDVVVAALPPVVVDTIHTTTVAATPRMDESGGEMINSGQSTPIHMNHVEESPLNAGDDGSADATAAGGDGDVERKEETLPDFNVTLHEAKVALKQQQQEEQQDKTSPAVDTKKEEEEEERNHPPQSKKETNKYDEGGEQQHDDNNGKNENEGSNKGNNLSQLKLDLERSEQEKREALEQVAKLKSLLEAGGIGKRNVTGNDDDQTPRMMTTIHNNTTPSKRPPGHNNIMTPRGGNTPNRYTPGRNRVGVPPLAWNSPRSGNSRAGSRVGSPEHHQYPFNPSGGGGGTPRVRASPLPKQLNRVVSDTQLNNKVTGEANGNCDVVPQEERVEEEFLVAAARSIPNEYGTTLASYFVRRPHITDDSLEKENDEADELAKVASNLWGTCTHLSSRMEYMKHASVFNPESLEIVACIEADGSVFTLSGECNVRHGKVSSGSNNGDDGNKEYEWSVFDNVEEMDRALGRVSYIDVEGNEREYWLGKKRKKKCDVCHLVWCV